MLGTNAELVSFQPYEFIDTVDLFAPSRTILAGVVSDDTWEQVYAAVPAEVVIDPMPDVPYPVGAVHFFTRRRAPHVYVTGAQELRDGWLVKRTTPGLPVVWMKVISEPQPDREPRVGGANWLIAECELIPSNDVPEALAA